MISFIAAHWWAWPFVYAAIGALLAGFFDITQVGRTWLFWLFLWPFFALTWTGSFLRNMW